MLSHSLIMLTPLWGSTVCSWYIYAPALTFYMFLDLSSFTLACWVFVCPLMSRNNSDNINYVKKNGRMSPLCPPFCLPLCRFCPFSSCPAGQRERPAEAELAARGSSISPLSSLILFLCVVAYVIVLPLLVYYCCCLNEQTIIL